jgi:terminase small subunit / prophage DNA-packing protein
MLDRALTQGEFAALVGITQQAVSDLQKRHVLRQSVTGAAWLLAYCEHLREQAAGRAGQLAEARAALDNERREEIAMRNAVKRREYLPAVIIAQVLARMGRQIAGILDGLVPAVRRRWPELTAEQLRVLEAEIARARNLAAAISVDDLAADDEAAAEEAA